MSTATPPPPSSPDPSAAHRRRRHRALLTYLLMAGGVATAIAAIGAGRGVPGASAPVGRASPPSPVRAVVAVPPPAARPRVELVFALDTTGSMSGLLEGAKRKIWSLASFVAQGQPTPELRVGLVAYRDVGDAYVTRVFDLDDDLDRVSARLRELRADGGGDTPEHVARALDEAVHKMSWSPGAKVVKVIYLVGDAPPHTDYQDGYDWDRAAHAAVQAQIAVHTIRCGGDAETELVWRKIARIGHGQFMSVEQDGGMHEVRTPFDDELARLHDRLSGTTIAYGAKAALTRSAMASAAAAPVEVKVDRARFLAAKHKAVGGGGDLVDDLAAGAVSLQALAPAALPIELRGLAPPALEAAVADKQKERGEISRRIDELDRKRAAHLEAEAKAAASHGTRDGFDAVAKAALRQSVEATPGAGFKL